MALTAGNRATAQERHRVKANDLAEQELERVRSLRIGDLANWSSTRRVLEDGTELAAGTDCPVAGQTCYTITSSTQFLNEPAATSTCASGTGSRDFLQLNVSVSWTGMGALHPVTACDDHLSTKRFARAEQRVAAGADRRRERQRDLRRHTDGQRGGILHRDHGIERLRAMAQPAGRELRDERLRGGLGTGRPGRQPAAWEHAHCPADRKRRGPGDQHGEPQYDRPGSIEGINFRTRSYSGSLVTSSADSAVVSASGMTQGRVYGTPGGARQSTFNTGSNLFPFTSPYTVYGGSCSANDPTADASAAGAYGSATVPPGGTATLASPGYVLLPSLLVTVHSGSSFLFPGSPVSSGKITVTELGSPTGCGVTRTLTTSTNSNGEVPVAGDVGLPYGTYSVCANNSGGSDKRVISPVDVHSTSGTTLDVYLNGQPKGTCP